MQTVTMQRRNPNIPLREKLREHYQNRDFTPSFRAASKFGLGSAAFLIFSMFLEALMILLPDIYHAKDEQGFETNRFGPLGESFWLALVVVIITWVEVTWNWWRTYYDVLNWVKKEHKEKLFGQMMETPPGWRHCPTCQLDAPPRSHHCQHCGHCILKRDHHCFFTGSCVGFYNQRHFVMFCIQSIWGCVLGLYLQFTYLGLRLPLTENYQMYIVPIPIFQLFAGNLSFGIFLLIVHVYLNAIVIGSAVFFLIWQLVIIIRGQTSHEAWKMIRIYDSGMYNNFTSVFGSPKTSWVLFFAPLLLPLEGDGIRWKVKAGKST